MKLKLTYECYSVDSKYRYDCKENCYNRHEGYKHYFDKFIYLRDFIPDKAFGPQLYLRYPYFSYMGCFDYENDSINCKTCGGLTRIEYRLEKVKRIRSFKVVAKFILSVVRLTTLGISTYLPGGKRYESARIRWSERLQILTK